MLVAAHDFRGISWQRKLNRPYGIRGEQFLAGTDFVVRVHVGGDEVCDAAHQVLFEAVMIAQFVQVMEKLKEAAEVSGCQMFHDGRRRCSYRGARWFGRTRAMAA